MSGSAKGEINTSNTGTGFAQLPVQFCRVVHIFNNTATDIEVQQDGNGVAVPIYSGTYFSFRGLVNLNQLAVRRVDTSNTPVTVRYRWEFR